MTDGKFKILSFRSQDAVFKPDPGVVPDDDICEKAGITVVQTGYQHTDMSDPGPDDAKSKIQAMLDKFLDDDSALRRSIPGRRRSPTRAAVAKMTPSPTDAGSRRRRATYAAQ